MSLAKRHAAASRFRPARVRLLLVAEAPPCALDRYFYFKDVPQHDWLFRYVYEGLTDEKPDRRLKAAHLAELRDAGVFMVDLHEENISAPKPADLLPEVPDLVRRCRELKPEHVVLIKSVVYDVAYGPLVAAGLPVIDVRMPFPSSGQQQVFLEAFRRAAALAGVTVVRSGGATE
jgi:hypothetical protein